MNVLVVFQSRLGSTESLALAAAVGAVQGRANIRLRWLQDAEVESSCKENRERMEREYVAPRAADAEWADAILAGMPGAFSALSPEFVRYFESLRAHGGVKAKFGAAFTSNSRALEQGFAALGLAAISFENHTDAREAARLQGRRVADACARQARSNLV